MHILFWTAMEFCTNFVDCNGEFLLNERGTRKVPSAKMAPKIRTNVLNSILI